MIQTFKKCSIIYQELFGSAIQKEAKFSISIGASMNRVKMRKFETGKVKHSGHNGNIDRLQSGGKAVTSRVDFDYQPVFELRGK